MLRTWRVRKVGGRSENLPICRGICFVLDMLVSTSVRFPVLSRHVPSPRALHMQLVWWLIGFEVRSVVCRDSLPALMDSLSPPPPPPCLRFENSRNDRKRFFFPSPLDLWRHDVFSLFEFPFRSNIGGRGIETRRFDFYNTHFCFLNNISRIGRGRDGTCFFVYLRRKKIDRFSERFIEIV